MKPNFLMAPNGERWMKSPRNRKYFTKSEMAEMVGENVSFVQAGDNQILCYCEDATKPINPITTPARVIGLIDYSQTIYGNALLVNASQILPMLSSHK